MALSRSYNGITSSGLSGVDDCLHEANSTDTNKDHITSDLSDDKDVDGGWAWVVLASKWYKSFNMIRVLFVYQG